MEVNFNIGKAIGNCDKNGICIINGLHIDKHLQKDHDNVSKLLDQIGSLSAQVYYHYL